MKKIIYEILETIEQNGHQAYLIGGYPRDLYLGRVTDDFDICTSATPENLKKIFSDILEENYGSLKIRYKNIIFEITTFRLEHAYTSIRTPIISFATSLKEDLVRRDFIINTLCIDSKGNYIDILGAKEDLNQKIIKSVGNPFQKMKEDPLRILRAIRFATILNFEIEENLKEAILENNDLVSNLSYYRKREELDKILHSENCNYGFQLLKDFHLENILECQFKEVISVPKLEVMWAQITFSPNYPFTKKERKEIDTIRHFLSKGTIDDLDLYYYGNLYFSFIAPVLKIDFTELNKRYQSLPIHSTKEIAIDVPAIQKIVKRPVSSVISLLEKKILVGELKNDEKEIIKFLGEYFR